MQDHVRVSIIIPTRNRREKLLRCLASLYKSDYSSIEIVVVDDNSDYDVGFLVKQEYPNVKVLRNTTRRFLSYSRNTGAEESSGELLFFLDDDNVVSPSAITELVRVFQLYDKLGVVAPIIRFLRNPSKVWSSYITKGRFPGFYVLGVEPPKELASTFSFHDAFMMRREVFEICERFDYRTFPIHFSELDFAHRLAMSGYEAAINPRAIVWHDIGRMHMNVDSERSFYTLRNRVILLKRYASRGEVVRYILFVLPGLTAYYLRHHLLYASDSRVRSVYNLVRGLVAGLAYRKETRPWIRSHEETRRTSTRLQERMISGLKHLPLVSIIVPTRNSEKTISRCLESLSRQTYPKTEIILIDNHSTDRTVEIAKTFRGVSIFTAGPERSAQVNVGARVAHGTYLYRVDSDFVVEPRVIEEAVIRCAIGGFKVVAVHNTSDPSISFWAAVRKLERDCYESDDINIAARFFTREVFKSIGGFDEDLIASEDYDLHNRLVAAGLKVGRIKSKELHLGEPRSLKEVVVKHVFYGKLIEGFITRNPVISWKQLGPLRMAYVRHGRDFLRDPKLTVGFILYQYVRYASSIAGYLTNKL